MIVGRKLSATGLIGRAISGRFVGPGDSGAAFSPLDLPGLVAWYDPSDLTTLFKDSAGLEPVTADGDPVGLMLDKSQGLALGSELLANGDFSAGAEDWALGTGWSISDGAATAGGVGNANYLQQNMVLPSVVKTYLISFDVSAYTSGNLRIFFGGAFSGTIPVSGPGRYYARMSGGGATSVRLSSSTINFVGSVDNISLREIAGSHARQATATRRSLYDTQTLNPDGVDDYYGLGQALNHEQFSVSAVCRVGGDNQRLVDNRGVGAYGTEPGWHLKARNSTGDLAIIGDNYGKYIAWSNSNGAMNYKPAIGETVLLTLRYSPTEASLRINGIDQGPPDRGTGIGSIGSILSPVDGNLFTASNSIGQQSFDGDFIGCVIVSRHLSTAEIEQVESYLAKLAGVIL